MKLRRFTMFGIINGTVELVILCSFKNKKEMNCLYCVISVKRCTRVFSRESKYFRLFCPPKFSNRGEKTIVLGEKNSTDDLTEQETTTTLLSYVLDNIENILVPL